MKYNNNVYKAMVRGAEDTLIGFNYIASKLFSIQNLLHHCHLQTRSLPRHEALGDAYKGFSELKDQIIECLIAAFDSGYGNLRTTDWSQFTILLPNEASLQVRSLAMEIEQFAKENNIPSVEGLAQSLHQVGLELEYKLRMDNSDEGSYREKAMSAGSVTGSQTWNDTSLSGAALKEEDVDKKMKVLTMKSMIQVPNMKDKDDSVTLDKFPKNVQKSFMDVHIGGMPDMSKGNNKFATVMREFHNGTLRSGSGAIVTDVAQAKAIAASEAGISKNK